MREAIDLGSPPPAAPTSESPGELLPRRRIAGLKGQIPLNPGQSSLSPAEEAALQAAEKAKLAQSRRAIQEETQQELKRAGRNRNLKDLVPPAERDISELPAQKQAEVRQVIKAFDAGVQTPPPPRSRAQSQVTPTAPARPPAREEEVPYQAADPSVARWKEFIERGEEPTEEEEDTTPDDAQTPIPGAGALTGPTHCPHCNWPLDQADDARASEDDQDRHAELLLGGQPFTKSYVFFKGQLTVLYRTLSQEASELAIQQCAQDATAGQIQTTADFVRVLLDYRLCLSIVELTLPKGITKDVASSVDRYLANGQGSVRELLDKIRKVSPLDQEPIWRVVQNGHRRFQRLAEKLEALSADPNS